MSIKSNKSRQPIGVVRKRYSDRGQRALGDRIQTGSRVKNADVTSPK